MFLIKRTSMALLYLVLVLSACRSEASTYNACLGKPTYSGSTPFTGSPITISPTAATNIPAENFDNGSQGVAHCDFDGTNNGGVYRNTSVDIGTCADGTSKTYCIGWVQNGEWLKYSVYIPKAGSYTFTARVASPNSGKTFRVQLDGTTIANITVPNTGSYSVFKSVSATVNLGSTGNHLLIVLATSDAFNLNWFALTPSTASTTPATVMLGARVEDIAGATPETALLDVENAIGRKLAIVHRNYKWKDSFPTSFESSVAAGGRTVMITWEPRLSGTDTSSATFEAISSGTFDSTVIIPRAKALNSFIANQGNRPLFLRFAHEMNGTWYPWHTNGATYVAAWQHVRKLFSQYAPKVKFVWCPNSALTNNFSAYYPGDAYVDWICEDGYNYGTTATTWKSFYTANSFVYNYYYGSSTPKTKPFMIGETGCMEDTTSGGPTKAQWFTAAASDIKTKMPHLRAFVYFDREPLGAETQDWRLNTPLGSIMALPQTPSLKSFIQMAHDNYFELLTVP